jgi:competence protein ComEC
VIRAGIAGALGSLAWLSARQRDRWHFLLVGALLLLAWSPYNLLDAGFQLSFMAVVAIFVAVPRAKEIFSGYPLPGGLPEVLAVSLACSVATAPILWLQFGRIPVYSVFANALAAPVVAPLLGLSFAAALTSPVSAGFAAVIATANGWLAAYLTWCARLVSALPGATVSSAPAAFGLLLLCTAGAGALELSRRGR